MTEDPGSLDNLHDIVMPPAVAFWPPAPGVWIIGAALVALLAIAAWHAVQRYQAKAYRRAAAAELDAIAGSATVEQVSAIIKRTALVAYPRAAVASLSGAAWAQFVAAKAGAGGEVTTLCALLSDSCDPHRHPSTAELRSLIDESRCWVWGHHPEAPGEAG